MGTAPGSQRQHEECSDRSDSMGSHGYPQKTSRPASSTEERGPTRGTTPAKGTRAMRRGLARRSVSSSTRSWS
jgi:hypothetical protein